MSANSNKMPLNVECLYEDRDFSSSCSREEFEALAAPYFQKIGMMFTNVLERAKDKWYSQKTEEKIPDFKIDSVEIVGGGSRIPAIKRLIKDVFGVEASSTLNTDEAVARGCALQCAMISPTFKVARQLEVFDYNMYPVNCRYWFDADQGKIAEIAEVFKRGSVVPYLRKITLNCSTLPLTMELDHVTESGKRVSNGQWKVTSAQPLTLNKNKLTVYVKLDHNGLAVVSSATVVVDAPVTANGESEVPMETDQQSNGDKAPPAEGAEKAEKKPKTETVHLVVSPVWIRGTFAEPDLQKLKDIEANLILADKNWKERIDARNELEEYVYEWRSKMEDGGYDPFVPANDKAAFLTALNDMQQWLYADEESGETQSKSVYLDKINDLKNKFSSDIVFRQLEYSSRDQYLERLGKSIQLGQKLLETEEKVDEKKIEKLRVELEEKQKWYDESHGVIQATPLHANPVITTKLVQERIDQIEQCTRPIMEELNRKRQEKLRAEEKKRKEEEEAKKKAEAEAAAAAAGGATMSTETPASDGQSGDAPAMEVDPQAPPAN